MLPYVSRDVSEIKRFFTITVLWLYFVYGGNWNGESNEVGGNGNYWSSVVYNSNNAYNLNFNKDGNLNPQNNNTFWSEDILIPEKVQLLGFTANCLHFATRLPHFVYTLSTYCTPFSLHSYFVYVCRILPSWFTKSIMGRQSKLTKIQKDMLERSG